MRQLQFIFNMLAIVAMPCVSSLSHAQDKPTVPESISEKSMKGELEAVFNSWRKASLTKNAVDWLRVTSKSRQIDVKNEIISQKLEFPDALFEVPFSAPSLENMQLLDIFTRRETSNSIYFGKADFRVGDPAQVKDNLIVLCYLKEEGRWRFDKLRIVKIPPESDIMGKLRLSDFSFLKGPEFQPPPQLPDLPQPVGRPDYIAEIWINSVGYETTIEVNGRETGTIVNARAKELVIGGLNKGRNTVLVKTKKIENIKLGVPDRVEIAIYAIKSIQDKPVRVFHFLPDPTDIPEEKSLSFGVSH